MAKIMVNGTDLLAFESLFPQQGDMIEITMVKDIRGKVRLTAEELEKMELKSADGRSTWNNTKAEEIKREVDLSESELTFLKGRVDELNKAKQITEATVALCVKIREGGKKGDNKGN